MPTNPTTPQPAPAEDADLRRINEFVRLINTGILPSAALDLVGFDTDAGEVYPEHACLTWDDSDLIDFTPLATNAAAIVVRRRSGGVWELEYRYRDPLPAVPTRPNNDHFVLDSELARDAIVEHLPELGADPDESRIRDWVDYHLAVGEIVSNLLQGPIDCLQQPDGAPHLDLIAYSIHSELDCPVLLAVRPKDFAGSQLCTLSLDTHQLIGREEFDQPGIAPLLEVMCRIVRYANQLLHDHAAHGPAWVPAAT